MNEQDMSMAIRALAGSSKNVTISAEFKNISNAKQLLNLFIVNLCKATGFTPEQLLEEHIILLGGVQNCTKSDEVVQNCTEVVQKSTGTLGHGTSLNEEVYVEMDRLLREGFSNTKISEKIGVHRNTVSRRRKLLGL